jgi:hypothetical protein
MLRRWSYRARQVQGTAHICPYKQCKVAAAASTAQLQCDSQSRITGQAEHKRPERGSGRGLVHVRACPRTIGAECTSNTRYLVVILRVPRQGTAGQAILRLGTWLVHGSYMAGSAQVLVGCYACGMSHYSGGAPSQCKADRCKHEARDPGGVGLARMGPKEPKTDPSLVVDGVRTWLLDPA